MTCWRYGERRLELAVVVVEHLVLGDAEAAPRLLRLGAPAPGERPSALGLVAGVAVRQRDELDGVPLLRPQDGGAAGVAVAVVGVGPEHDDAQGRVGGRGRSGGHGEGDGQGGQDEGTESGVGHRLSLLLQGNTSRTRFFANGSTSRATANRLPATAPRTRASDS